MRVIPVHKAAKENAAKLQIKIEKTARIVALALAFFSTFFFFIKLLFL